MKTVAEKATHARFQEAKDRNSQLLKFDHCKNSLAATPLAI